MLQQYLCQIFENVPNSLVSCGNTIILRHGILSDRSLFPQRVGAWQDRDALKSNIQLLNSLANMMASAISIIRLLLFIAMFRMRL